MSNNNNLNNNLELWLELDQDYKTAKKIARGNLFKKIKLTYMPNQPFSLFTFYLKHNLAAFILGFLLFTSIGAFAAAELAAPDQYKPSKVLQNYLYSNNSQPDKNPFTALKPDAQNDVVNFSQCGVSLKYPKQIGNVEVSASYGTWRGYSPKGPQPLAGVGVLDSFQLECYNSSDFSQSQNSALNFWPKVEVLADSAGVEFDTLKPLEIDKFYELTNWFIFEGELSEVYKITTFDTQKLDPAETHVRFNYNGKTYFVTFFSSQPKIKNNPDLPSLIGKDVQLQFNNLVESEANAEIKEAPETKTEEQANSKNSSESDSVASSSSATNKTTGNYYTDPGLPDLKVFLPTGFKHDSLSFEDDTNKSIIISNSEIIISIDITTTPNRAFVSEFFCNYQPIESYGIIGSTLLYDGGRLITKRSVAKKGEPGFTAMNNYYKTWEQQQGLESNPANENQVCIDREKSYLKVKWTGKTEAVIEKIYVLGYPNGGFLEEAELAKHKDALIAFMNNSNLE